MFSGMSMGELVMIFVVVLLLFGSHRVPEMFRNFGKAINEFKKGMRDIESSAPPAPPHPAEIAMHPPQASLPAPGAKDAHGHDAHGHAGGHH